MSKYSPDQLKAMAKIVIADYNVGGQNSLNLIIIISMRTGLDANAVRDRIRFLAHV